MRVCGGQYREELILNLTVFVVCLGSAIEMETNTNVILLVVMVLGGQYREEQVLIVTVFVVKVWGI